MITCFSWTWPWLIGWCSIIQSLVPRCFHCRLCPLWCTGTMPSLVYLPKWFYKTIKRTLSQGEWCRLWIPEGYLPRVEVWPQVGTPHENLQRGSHQRETQSTLSCPVKPVLHILSPPPLWPQPPWRLQLQQQNGGKNDNAERVVSI